jgi:flagellar FliL protein
VAKAAAAEAAPAKKGPSIVVQIVLLLVLVGVGLGGGWFVGGYLKGQVPPAAPAAAGEAKTDGEAAAGHGEATAGGHGDAGGGHGGGGHGEEAAAGGHGEAAVGADGAPVPTQTLFELAPITTNLAAPNDVWARLEVAIEFDTPPTDESIVEIVHQDLLSYLRTVKMHQLEGASGIQHLRADLEDRASVRTEGRVKGVFIRTLLFE